MKSVGRIPLLVACLFFVTSAYAQKFDAKKSQVEWLGEKLTGQHNGKVDLKSAELDIAKKKGEFVVDMTSITVDDLSGDLKDRLTNHLKSDDFFAVDKNKTATLKVTSIESTGKDKYKAKGDLTIKKITKPAEFHFSKKAQNLEGELDFDRTHYDIKYRSGSFFKDLGDKLIKDKVTLKFKLVPLKG